MDFTVRASIKHPDLHPQKVKLFGAGSIADASELLLDAVHEVQQRAGVRSTRDYVSEATRAFTDLEQLLDNAGIQCGASMPGLLDGVASLAQEVTELRLACTTAPPHMHSGQLLELTEQRNLAQAEARRLSTELASVTDTLREVRTALNVAPEAHDGDLVEIARDVRGWADAWLELTAQRLAEEIHNGRSAAGIDVGISWRNLSETMRDKSVRAAEYALGRLTDVARPSAPATPGQVARILFEASRKVAAERGTEPIPMTDRSWEESSQSRQDWWRRMARWTLDDAGISVPSSLLPVTAMELARAIHAAVMEHPNPDDQVVDEAFEDAPPEWSAWRLRVSQSTLDRLPSIAAPKSEFPPVTAAELAKALHESRCAAQSGVGRVPMFIGLPWDELDAPSREHFERVAQGGLDRLPSIAAPKTEFPPVSPEQLAHAIHNAVGALNGGRAFGEKWVPWEDGPAFKERRIRVAEIALSELPQIVRKDAETDAEFNAHMNTVFTEYQGMVSTLAAQRDRAQGEAQRHKDAAAGLRAAWNTVAGKLGMSFGREFDGAVVAPMIVEAIGQLEQQHSRDLGDMRRARHEAEEWVGTLQGMVRGVADQLKLDVPEGGLFKPGPFGEALRARLAELSGRAFNLCAPLAGDWLIELRPEGSGTVSNTIRPGDKLGMEDGVFTATLRYIGDQPPRPDGRLVLPSASAEDLARAWMETPSGNGQGFPWAETHPESQRDFVEHARKVIHFLSLQNMVTGKLDQARVDWERFARQGRKTGVAAFDGPPGKFFLMSSSGEVVEGRSFLVDEGTAEQKVERVGALLDQVRELGAEVRSLRTMHAERLNLFARLAEVIGVDGASDAEIVESIALTYADFNARIPALVEEIRDKRVSLANALGVSDQDPQGEWLWVHLLSRVAELANDERNVQALSRKHCDDLRQALGSVVSGWDDLIRKVSALAGESAQARREASDRRQDLQRALGIEDSLKWEDLISNVVVHVRNSGRADELQSRLRDTEAGCRVAARLPEGTPHGRVMVFLNEAVTAMADIRRELALEPDVHVSRVSREVRKLAERAEGAGSLAQNAIMEINRLLGLNEKQFPAGTVDKVRELTSTEPYRQLAGELAEALGMAKLGNWEWQSLLRRVEKFRRAAVLVSDDAQDGRRIRDAALTLLEAAGIDERTNVNAVVQKAGDAAAILRSWPDVARVAEQLDTQDVGDLVGRPDEVAPVLQYHAEKWRELEAAAARKTIKVLSHTQTWFRGERERDKAFHTGCGGEVGFAGDKDGAGIGICGDCLQTCVPHEGSALITVTEMKVGLGEPVEGNEQQGNGS